MDLNSGRVITRPRVWEIPVTTVVIRAVETMAEEQGIKSLKLQNRRKTTFYPADWIAGVDYNNKNNDHDDEDDTEYENEENNNLEYEDDNAIEEEENFDRVDQQEIDELMADMAKKKMPIQPTWKKMKLKNSKKKRHKRMMPKRILSRKHNLSECNHQETVKHRKD
ncbi:MAG: hypothetical protein ACP5NL_07590 [Thermoplasmata archaeon]